MTTTAIPMRSGWIIPQADRGVSDEAARVQAILDAARRSDLSMTIGERRRQAHRALDEIWRHSREGAGEEIAVQPATIQYAREFLLALPPFVSNPDIYADSDGEIVFEWDSGRRQIFSVSIGQDGTLTYAGLFGHKRAHGTEELAGAVPQIIAAGIIRADGQTS